MGSEGWLVALEGITKGSGRNGPLVFYHTICMIILASSVQGALRKLLESDLITFEEGSYKVSDKFFQMYLLRLQQSERIFL